MSQKICFYHRCSALCLGGLNPPPFPVFAFFDPVFQVLQLLTLSVLVSYNYYKTKSWFHYLRTGICHFFRTLEETRGSVGWACVAHLSFWFEETLYRTFHMCFLPNCCSFGLAVSREKILQKSTNQKQELPMATMFVSESSQNEQSL